MSNKRLIPFQNRGIIDFSKRKDFMEDCISELVRLTNKQVELQKQLEATGLLQLIQKGNEAIAKIKEQIKDEVSNGTIPTGKREIALPSGDTLAVEPRRGAIKIEVYDVNALPENYQDKEELPNSGVLDDGTMYQIVEGSQFYTDNGKVYQKVANEGLIKNYAKLGSHIDGVVVKQSQPSVVIKLNGKAM